MRLLQPCPTSLVLILDDEPLALWLYLDPGRRPLAAWFCSSTGRLLAEVPVVNELDRSSPPAEAPGGMTQ